MLVLTCRIGDTLRIGDGICMTVQSRFRNRVTVGVVAPAGVDLYFDNACLHPSVLPGGVWSYLFSMLAVRRYRVGDVEICVWLPGDTVSLAADCDEFLHVGAFAPKHSAGVLRTAGARHPVGGCPIASALRSFFPLCRDEAITPC